MPTAVVELRNANQRMGYHHGAQLVQASAYFGTLTRFNFPYAPVEVSYSEMSNKWEEYKRPGDFSILDSSGPSNFKVQMQFRYANPISSGNTSIEAELNQIRLIGLDPGPVWFINMDTYLSSPISPSLVIPQWGLRLALFRIADLTVTVKRRNPQNEATQADISISLIEDRVPMVADVSLPTISYDDSVTRWSDTRVATGGSSPQRSYTDVSGRPQ